MVEIGELIKLLSIINVTSIDNGKIFTDLTKINNINNILKTSNYKLLHEGNLCYIWEHKKFNKNLPVILVSCHADSIYKNHSFSINDDKTILGTFDNSINNAILVLLMMNNLLHSNVLITFTGDEEEDSKGAAETVYFLSNNDVSKWEDLVTVISLDVTGEGYDTHDFSIENWFIEKKPIKEPKTLFKKKKHYKKYLESIFHEEKYKILYIGDKDERAAEDESWEYDEHDLNCFSLCLPSLFHPENKHLPQEDWMHNDKGILIKIASINCFIETIPFLCEKLIKDFS